MPTIQAPTIEAHRALTTEQLLDAWGGLVRQQGYESVTLADVAEQAGLARTAIYNYFGDRESLSFAWTEGVVHFLGPEVYQRFMAHVEPLCSARSHPSRRTRALKSR